MFTILITHNTTQNNCISSHAQNTTALQADVFFTGIHRLLVTNKERSAFPSADHCQGQLQTRQSLSVARRLTRNNKPGVTAYVSVAKTNRLVR